MLDSIIRVKRKGRSASRVRMYLDTLYECLVREI